MERDIRRTTSTNMDTQTARQLAQSLFAKNQALERELVACHRCIRKLRKDLEDQVRVTSDVWDRRGSDVARSPTSDE